MSTPTWTCDACGQAVGDAGTVSASIFHANNYGEALEKFDNHDTELRTVGDLIPDYVKLAEIGASPWRCYHYDCDPDPNGEGYWVPTNEMQSWPGVIHWQNHLADKTWFQFTDWNHLLLKASGQASWV